MPPDERKYAQFAIRTEVQSKLGNRVLSKKCFEKAMNFSKNEAEKTHLKQMINDLT